jgi:phosphoribosylformimino-5-aminoimidazole carboxamide ribotide isomerase
MIVIPAIDLKDGRCVRLRQGRADDATIYADDPVQMARYWAGQGAQWLHVVDLDGAFEGRPVHTRVISRIVAAIDIPVEIGGGLRSDEHVRQVLDAGVARAIVGTRAFAHPEELAELAGQCGARLAVGIDARDGWVQVKGWVETTRCRAIDLAGVADRAGVQAIIYTDTATDGMLKGPNVEAMGEMCDAVGCAVIASGGVSSADDIRALRGLERANHAGAIVGKALYEKTVSMGDLILAAET